MSTAEGIAGKTMETVVVMVVAGAVVTVETGVVEAVEELDVQCLILWDTLTFPCTIRPLL